MVSHSNLDLLYGKMSLEYVLDKIAEFDCKTDPDLSTDVVDKLNQISCSKQVKNSELLDSLVAYATNIKCYDITLNLLSDFERQVYGNLPKPKQSCSATKRANNNSARSVLKEISIPKLGSEVQNDDDDFLFNNGLQLQEEFQAFDDDRQFVKNNANSTPFTTKNWSNLNNSELKCSWRGDSFLVENELEDDSAINQVLVKPNLKLVTADNDSFKYGSENIIAELYSDPMVDDDDSPIDEGQFIKISGRVFPIDERILTFDNAHLFTFGNQPKVLKLDFENIDKVALFSGKTLTIEGVLNETVFQIENILEIAPLTSSPLNLCPRLAMLRVLVACGPFSLDTDAGTDHLFDLLMQTITKTQINVLILIGPFAPKSTCREIKHSYFDRLSNFLKRSFNSHLRVIVVPSALSDISSEPYFPTPPYYEHESYKNIDFLPDPAIFELEGVRFAVTASEIIAHLSKHELYKSLNTENEDRMSRLISHLFSSHSLYPLIPSDLNLPFNFKNSHNTLKLTDVPHILIVPSILQPMAKIVDQCIVVNPGRFVRGKLAGTFATICVNLNAALKSNSVNSVKNFSEVTLQPSKFATI